MSRRYQLTIILFLILPFFTACDGTSARGSLVESDSFQGVIFTAEQIAADEYWPNNDGPWTPSKADIITLEEQLPGFLQEEYPALWQKLDDYARQYWGTITPDGNRAVYASFFCDADTAGYWRTNYVMGIDGGDCYFQALYDVEDGIFVWLAINGEA